MTELTVNGHGYAVAAEVGRSLADVLRDDLGLTGTKIACGEGHCGACTVQLDGVPVLSCITLVHTVEGREITTIEGLREHPLVAARDLWATLPEIENEVDQRDATRLTFRLIHIADIEAVTA